MFLFAGMVPWGFLSGSLNECAMCIITNEALIRKIFLPKLVFPLSRVLINLVTLLLSMGASVPAALAAGGAALVADDSAAGGHIALRRFRPGARA